MLVSKADKTVGEFKELLIGAWWRDEQVAKGAEDGKTQKA